MSYLTTKPLVDEKYLTGRRKDSERSDDWQTRGKKIHSTKFYVPGILWGGI